MATYVSRFGHRAKQEISWRTTSILADYCPSRLLNIVPTSLASSLSSLLIHTNISDDYPGYTQLTLNEERRLIRRPEPTFPPTIARLGPAVSLPKSPLSLSSQSTPSTTTMPFFSGPTSFRLANQDSKIVSFVSQSSSGFLSALKKKKHDLPPHSSHPDFGHLTLLVFEAVLEVVFVSLPGYIVARQGMFDAEAQKFLANLNVMIFTPCLSTSPRDEAVIVYMLICPVFDSIHQTCIAADG